MTAYPAADARLNKLGLSRWRTGHPWVYRAGVEVVEEETGSEPIARVLDPRGRFLGQALLSRESQISLRMLTRSDQPVNREFLKEKLQSAFAYRKRVLPDREALRLVFSESDGLPGLIVDRYGSHLVLQSLTWGMNALQDDVTTLLRELLQPESIFARNDPAVRTLEGLPRETIALFGDTPETVSYREGSVVMAADLRGGQKTGAYLDQAENRTIASSLARGTVLDIFTSTGSFALAAASGAEKVIGVDSSAPALAAARASATRNQIENVEFLEANAFDYLKNEDRQRRQVDMVILDPPAFAKNKRELESALRGYKEINLRAMKILKPGGILVTCSCSYHLSETLMDEVIGHAAADTHRTFRVVHRTRQSPDHPVRAGFPESLYLKCQILELMD